MIKTDKLIINCCVTGNMVTKKDNPNLAEQPEEIAEEVYRAWNAGASIVHLHVRDKNGIATTDGAVFKQVDELIREKGCDIIIQHSTAPGREPDADIEDGFRALEVKPEMITIDIGIQVNHRSHVIRLWDRQFVTRIVKAANNLGVKPEFEIYTVGGVHELNCLVKEGLVAKPVWVDFVLGMEGSFENCTPYTHKNLMNLAEQLPEDSMFLTAAIGARETPAVIQSILLGGHARVGFEDNVYFSKGVLAKSNAQLVERIANIGMHIGRKIASPNEARELLGIPPIKL